MPNIGSFVISTIKRQLKPRINDAAYNDCPLLAALRAKNAINFNLGGDGFQSRLRNTQSSAGGATEDFALQNLKTTQPFGTVSRVYRKYIWNLLISLLQDYRNNNAGNEAQMFKMKMQQINEVCQSAISRICSSLYTGNSVQYTGDTSTPIDGLADIVSSTNTYAGLNRSLAANAFWRSQIVTVDKFTADSGNIGIPNGVRKMRQAMTYASYGKQTDMNTVSRDLATAKDKPDIIVTHVDMFNAYVDSLHNNVRWAKVTGMSGGADAQAAEETAEFGGISFTHDPFCPALKMYFLNSRHLSYDNIHKDIFDIVFDGVIPIPYLAHVFALASQGQFYSDNPRYLASLTATEI